MEAVSNGDISWQYSIFFIFLSLFRIVLYFEIFQCYYVTCTLLSRSQIIYMQNCSVWYTSRRLRKIFSFLATSKGRKSLASVGGIHLFQNFFQSSPYGPDFICSGHYCGHRGSEQFFKLGFKNFFYCSRKQTI